MEITLNSLLQAKDMVQILSSIKLKAKTSWQLLKVAKKIESANAEFEQIKNERIREYGTQHEDGTISVEPGTSEYMNLIAELNELLASTVTLDIQKIPLSELEDLEIDIMELFKIEWLIQE